MLHTPAFKAHLQAVPVHPDKVFLLSEFAQRVVRGRSSLRVIELIDGLRSTDEIVAALDPHVSMRQVYYVLALLHQQGYLEEACPDGDRPAGAYWTSLGIDRREARGRLERASVRVIALGAAGPQPLTAALTEAGVRLLDAAEADLWVVLADDYLRDELAAINGAALALGKPWLLVRPSGVEVWVGPLFRPQVTGCWACLQARMRTHRAAEGFLRQETGLPVLAAPLARLPSTNQIALGLAAHEICRWIAAGQSALEGQIISFHTGQLHTREHVLVRRPWCGSCGAAPAEPPESIRPIALGDGPEQRACDGGYRSVAPEQTVQTYQHLVSPICGVVASLKRVSDAHDRVCHVYVSGSNQAMGYRTYGMLRQNMRSLNSGKGVSDAQARASAIGEAIERYSGCFQGYEPRVVARMRDLGERAIDPRSCMLYSDAQYRERSVRNSRHNPFEYIPRPFDPQAAIAWSPLWSLTRREVRYLPTSYCYYNYQDGEQHSFCGADSNGCAAGNTLEEAILQGLLELVERDCVAIWWYNRIRRPRVDLASFEEPYIADLQAHYRTRQRELWVLDVSNDLGIAAFVAISRRTDRPAEMLVFAAGCHLDPRIALLRALTELNQIVAGLDRVDLREGRDQVDTATAEWLLRATVASEPYLLPDPALPPRRREDLPQLGGGTLRDGILRCQAIIEQQGMELLVLDQTRSDIGMPVVKVVVPELRFFWARFAPGRLYEVPVRLGWLPAPLREDQLNPQTIFI
jgi:ribosomal protein S12 methylthiotransferase accessory factor